MGRDRTSERQAANQQRRAERRVAIAAENACLTADAQAGREATRLANRLAHPGQHRLVLTYRRNPLVSLDFSSVSAPYDDEPAHPEAAAVKRTRAAVLEAAQRNVTAPKSCAPC